MFAGSHQEFGNRQMSVELVCYVKAITVFYKFYFFYTRHSLINRPRYNNLFQILQHNFGNLSRVIFT